MALLVSDDVDFKANRITGDKQGYFMMIKGSDTSRRYNNIKFVASNRTIKYLKQKLTKEISKNMEYMNNIIN